jgi:Flp pilus assembly pilin Flp
MFNAYLGRLYLKLQDAKEREEGQGVVEYALVLGLVAVAAVVVLELIGDDVFEALGLVEDNIGTDGTQTDPRP